MEFGDYSSAPGQKRFKARKYVRHKIMSWLRGIESFANSEEEKEGRGDGTIFVAVQREAYWRFFESDDEPEMSRISNPAIPMLPCSH